MAFLIDKKFYQFTTDALSTSNSENINLLGIHQANFGSSTTSRAIFGIVCSSWYASEYDGGFVSLYIGNLKYNWAVAISDGGVSDILVDNVYYNAGVRTTDYDAGRVDFRQIDTTGGAADYVSQQLTPTVTPGTIVMNWYDSNNLSLTKWVSVVEIYATD